VSFTRKQGLLQRAALLMGRDQLASRLDITEELLDAWMHSDATIPDGRLLALATALAELAARQK
jgi:hypothetical protein